MLFTFKRDDAGRETIHVGGVAIARVTDHPEGFEWLASPPDGVTAEHVREASVKADEEKEFWYRAMTPSPPPLRSMMWGPYSNNEVTVDVSIHETTSTILSLTTEDE